MTIALPNLDQARKQELLRLDALVNTYGPMAANGDHKAADVVLKAISTRAKILGLDSAKTLPTPPPEPARPVIDATVLAAKRQALTAPLQLPSGNTTVRP